MDREISKRIILEQVAQINPVLKQRYGWEIEVDEMTVYVRLKSSKDSESYMLRIQCDDYPEKNPVMQFVNPETRNSEPKAWPVDQPTEGSPVFRQDMTICLAPPPPAKWETLGERIHRMQFYLDYEGYKGRRSG